MTMQVTVLQSKYIKKHSLSGASCLPFLSYQKQERETKGCQKVLGGFWFNFNPQDHPTKVFHTPSHPSYKPYFHLQH